METQLNNSDDFEIKYETYSQVRLPSLHAGRNSKSWSYVEHLHTSSIAMQYAEETIPVDGMEAGTYRLGLWLFPVRLDIQFTEKEYALFTGNLLSDDHFASKLSCAMKMSNEGKTGWVYTIPQLLSLVRLQEADIGDLLMLPARAEAAVLGSKYIVTLNGTSKKCAGRCADHDPSVYFLPFVVRLPAINPIKRPLVLNSVDNALVDWINESGMTLPGFQGILPLVSPFSEIMQNIITGPDSRKCREFGALPTDLQVEILANEFTIN